eukprot:1053802-Lingulodinium_polyedra.AAC.1
MRHVLSAAACLIYVCNPERCLLLTGDFHVAASMFCEVVDDVRSNPTLMGQKQLTDIPAAS